MKLNKYFTPKFLAFIGFMFLITYLWLRYIRERLPREIPFEPILLNIIILTIIFLTYFYTALRLIKPKEPPAWLNYLILKLYPLYSPWYNLDHFIRESPYTRLHFHRFMNYVGEALKNIINIERNLALYFLWYILPRVILMLLLCIDIFYLKQLYYVYKYIYLTLSIPISYYIIYCIRTTLKQYIEYLNYYHEVQVTSGDFTGDFFEDDEYLLYGPISIERFISCQTIAINSKHKLFTYECVFKQRYNTDAEEIILSPSERKVMEKEFFRLILLIIRFQLFLRTYDFKTQPPIGNYISPIRRKIIYLKRIVILITSVYTVCWGYILILTILNIQDISFLQTICNDIEPFSGLII